MYNISSCPGHDHLSCIPSWARCFASLIQNDTLCRVDYIPPSKLLLAYQMKHEIICTSYFQSNGWNADADALFYS